ncbi:heat shock cognate 70 kDa protein [Spinacia oleracea]|uniref:Heat shock cognate 70 kDa protein n=1 Tax=Spinacia oleracea TaxID=3562 RepID=A0A9R0HY28_SPIOL|nr:heat shock cognate 70 kDa protein-like [Spinacia oleracea]
MKPNRNNKVSPVEKVQCHAIGIDLGTTNSCAAVWKRGRVEIIANDKGSRTTPSCVSFTETEHLTGDAAKNQIGLNSANTIYGVTRLIGRTFSDESVQHNMKLWPFKVVAGIETKKDRKPMIAVSHKGEEKQFSAEEISAMVLMKMKESAECYLGSKVTDAVVTVPAHFNASQRQATKDAGDIAGLNVIRIINEPVAAAVAYAVNKRKQTSTKLAEKVIIFDFGGGTLDVCLLTIDKHDFKVKAIVGDAYLGGDDIDDRMVSHFAGYFERKHGKDISGNPRALARLRTACERAKRELSSACETTIEINCLFESIDFFSVVSRSLFEKLNVDLFKRCIDCVKKCVQDGEMKMSDIHTVVLVGGSSRIPKVQQMLQDLFEGKKLYRDINPDESVAYGAAILSKMLCGEKNTSNCKFADLTPLSLGVEVYGGWMSVVVPKNITIPTKKTRGYTTKYDNQTTIRFSVYEGEKLKAIENKLLDEFDFTDIPKAPAGIPKFDVYFDINSLGILTVTAEYRGTTNKQQITITNCSSTGQFKIALERMIKDTNKINPNNFMAFAGAMLKSIRNKLKQMAC